jgi:hypothetical protein
MSCAHESESCGGGVPRASNTRERRGRRCLFVCLCRQALRTLELFATYDVKMICYLNTNKIDAGSYLVQVGYPLPSFAHPLRTFCGARIPQSMGIPCGMGIPLSMVCIPLSMIIPCGMGISTRRGTPPAMRCARLHRCALDVTLITPAWGLFPLSMASHLACWTSH